MTSTSFSSTSVPCTCPGSATGGDGLALFELKSERQIEKLSDMKERAWHCVTLDLQLPNPTIVLLPRVGHALVSIQSRGKIYMIGGGNEEGSLTEVWKIDYTLPASIEMDVDVHLSLDFPGRYEFFCALSKAEDKIWVFGGADVSDTNNDVFYIDVARGIICEVDPPPKLMNIFGDPEPEPEVNPETPSQRTQGNNSCLIELDGVEHLIVFGGGYGKDRSVTDGHLYKFNTSEVKWSRVKVTGSSPIPVQGHAMVAIGTKIYLFGGMEDMRLFDDFFMIDLSCQEVSWNKIRVTGPKPSPRAAHGITTVGSSIYIFGGVGEHGSLADLWQYNTETQEWTLIDSGCKNVGTTDEKRYDIQPRLDMGMASASVMVTKSNGDVERGDIIVVNSGMNTMGHLFDDTWIFPLYL